CSSMRSPQRSGRRIRLPAPHAEKNPAAMRRARVVRRPVSHAGTRCHSRTWALDVWAALAWGGEVWAVRGSLYELSIGLISARAPVQRGPVLREAGDRVHVEW